MDILWDKTVKIIKETVSQQNFETWIRPIRITLMEGDAVHLSVPNRFFRDWLQTHTPVWERIAATAWMSDIR